MADKEPIKMTLKPVAQDWDGRHVHPSGITYTPEAGTVIFKNGNPIGFADGKGGVIMSAGVDPDGSFTLPPQHDLGGEG